MGLQQRIRSRNFEDVRVVRLLRVLSKGSNFWKSVAERLSKPRNNRIVVNLSKLDRFVSSGYTLVVPGKVLGTGNISTKATIAAYSFSEKAKERIQKIGGETLTLEELFEKDPKGKNVKMVI